MCTLPISYTNSLAATVFQLTSLTDSWPITKMNLGLNVCPQGKVMIIERLVLKLEFTITMAFLYYCTRMRLLKDTDEVLALPQTSPPSRRRSGDPSNKAARDRQLLSLPFLLC